MKSPAIEMSAPCIYNQTCLNRNANCKIAC